MQNESGTTNVLKHLKQITKGPIYDITHSLKLAADASAYGVRAVLSHCYADDSDSPIAFTSRTLTAAEILCTDKEALSLM